MIQIGATAATLDKPLEHLMACHRRIEQRLETLVKAAEHLETEPARALEAIQQSLRFLDSNGMLHTEDEEESVFPRLRPELSPDEVAFLDTLEAQHQQAETIYAELKQRVQECQEPSDIAAYRECAQRLQAFYRDHIHAEDTVLNPIARRALSDASLAEIASEMRARRTGAQ